MKTKWLDFMDTHVLLVLDEQNLVPEWQPRGYVLKRQVYEDLPATWYAYEILPEERGVLLIRSVEPDREEAQRVLVGSVTGTGRA